jgi:predicted regulator of Ras-like GTPase activity (Roadblock/LC7/MglB family)
MHKLFMISRGVDASPKADRLIVDLRKKGFFEWYSRFCIQGSDRWWQEFEQTLEQCQLFIALLLPSAKVSPRFKRELTSVRARGIPIIPLLVEGDAASSMPDELIHLEWIDVSSDETYDTGLKLLIEKLYTTLGFNLNANHQTIHHELDQITLHIPDVRWIRIISIDGLAHPMYRFDADLVKPETDEDSEEDRLGPMSAASLSLSERIASEFDLGKSSFVVISGEAGTHILLPNGDGTEWCISFVVKGHPPIDQTIKYFKDRAYLAHIIPLLTV